MSSTLPRPMPNRTTFMLDRDGDLRDMGKRPRLTWGERLLGGGRTFYQIDMTVRTAASTFETDSATGRKRFRVHLEVDYRVADAPALVAAQTSGETDADGTVLTAVRREIEEISPDVLGKDNQILRRRIREELDPARGGARRVGPLEVVRVAARVEAPEGVNLPSEADDQIDDLDRRRIAALARGDRAAAEHLGEAIEAILALEDQDGARTGRRAEMVMDITRRIERAIREGAAPGSPEIRALRGELRSYAEKGGGIEDARGDGIEDRRADDPDAAGGPDRGID